ncbi:GlxA family transcriptional regulator [Roseovarius sp. SCSIO 43702]|nr:GlxA family transcriptional regulator [Roseovarius sp. SCSIO 43702]
MQKWTNTDPAQVRIAFLVFEDFSNLCMANCLEPLRAANAVTHRHVFDWRILTLDGAPVQTSSGIGIVPDGALSSLTSCDYLFVHASYGHITHDTAATRRTLRAAASKAVTTVGLDAGPWLMASAGLLAGRRATIHWDLLTAFSERFLDIDVTRARYLRDGPVITCAGALSALDLVLALVSAHLGQAARLDVEDQFIKDTPRGGLPGVGDPLVGRALDLMREHVEAPLPLAELSRRLSCQPRTLDRHFRRGLGAPPGTVYRHLRLSAARKMLEGTGLGVAEIALRCGYDSPAALSRAVRGRFGTTPTELRQRTM